MSLPRRGVVVALAAGLMVGVAPADPPKPEKVDGHWSVLSVTLTLRSGKADRKGLLVGTTDRKDGVYYSAHQFKFSDGDKTDGMVWLDTLAAVRETTDDGATLVFKTGATRIVRYGKEGSRCILLRTENDGQEVIELEAVKELKVLHPARVDDDGNAMFDHWKFSPYTGQKLTPVADKR